MFDVPFRFMPELRPLYIDGSVSFPRQPLLSRGGWSIVQVCQRTGDLLRAVYVPLAAGFPATAICTEHFALTAVNCGVTGLALLLTALTINLPKGSSNQVVPEDKYAIRDRSDGSRLGSPTESERSFKDRGPEAIQDKLSGGGSRKDRAGATTFADLDAFASMGRARRAGRTLMAGPQRRALDRIDMSPDPRGTVPPSPSGVNTQLKR